MNKMTKGALATGLGVALLLGGGGTLAVWNQTADAQAGNIVAGDLAAQTNGAATWLVDGAPLPAGKTISDYQIVPGQTVTYSQDVDLTLVGDRMQAGFALTGLPTNRALVDLMDIDAELTVASGNASEVRAMNLDVTGPVPVVRAAGVLTPNNDGMATVSATLVFPDTTTKRDGATESIDLSLLGFELRQIAPSSN